MSVKHSVFERGLKENRSIVRSVISENDVVQHQTYWQRVRYGQIRVGGSFKAGRKLATTKSRALEALTFFHPAIEHCHIFHGGVFRRWFVDVGIRFDDVSHVTKRQGIPRSSVGATRSGGLGLVARRLAHPLTNRAGLNLALELITLERLETNWLQHPDSGYDPAHLR